MSTLGSVLRFILFILCIGVLVGVGYGMHEANKDGNIFYSMFSFIVGVITAIIVYVVGDTYLPK